MLLLFPYHKEENHTARDCKGDSDRIDDQISLTAGLRQNSHGILDVNGRKSETRTVLDISAVGQCIAVGNLNVNRNNVGITIVAGRSFGLLDKILAAFEQHFLVLVIEESTDTVAVGDTGGDCVALCFGVSLGLVQFKFSTFEGIAFFIVLMYLNVIGIDIYLVTVNLTLDVVLIGVGELDRLVRITDKLGSSVLIQNSGKLDRYMIRA